MVLPTSNRGLHPVPAVLRVPELLRQVVAMTPVTSLLSLALVCRATSKASLEVLWRTLLSPLPLFKLVSTLSFVDKKWRLQELSPPASWDSYDQYSRYVVRIYSFFSSEPTGLVDIDINIFLFLHTCRPQVPLFPALHSATLTSMRPSYSTILPFMSPNLQEIDIAIPKNDPPFMQELHQVAPNIVRIHVRGHLSPSTIAILAQFPKLISISIVLARKTSPNAHSAQVEALRRLRFPSSVLSMSFNFPLRFQAPFLPIAATTSLVRLHIQGTIENITASVKLAPNLMFVVLRISNVEPVSKEDLTACFEVLRATSQTTLRAVMVICNGAVSLSGAISPLLDIPTINRFILEYQDTSDLDFTDDDVGRAVQAWPSLTAFVLPTNVHNTYQLTSRSLRALSTLQHIKDIQLPVGKDVASVPLDRCKSRNTFLHSYLEELFSPAQLGTL
ncbi:hypothetical protein NLJ89_g8346 [Agrocybe chaxingu]|uniref:F-box domain-containing protein n=1 Tax=Agrocybe chaxingu TaxID=84603 RepID=A0A9W8JST3_9AGAR|nr:hypothetical protein NLJ89_g8346 [Agrocybe chaxingu]